MGQLLNNPHRSELQHYSVRHTNYLIADVQHQGRSVFMLLHFTRIPAKTNKNESNQKAENTFPFFLSSCSWMCGEMVNKTLWSHEWSLCSRNHNMAFVGGALLAKASQLLHGEHCKPTKSKRVRKSFKSESTYNRKQRNLTCSNVLKQGEAEEQKHK